MAGSALRGTPLDGADDVVPIAVEGDGPLMVREKFHAATPMSIDQALLEMELVGHDFFLFRDAERGHPSVVYRRHGYQYGVIRLVEGEARSAPGGAGQASRLPAGTPSGLPSAGLPGPGALGR